MLLPNRGFVNRAACTAIGVALWIVSFVPLVAAQSSWQAEWEKTLRAAEAEGQFALYGCCYDYDRVLEVFRKRYPKIKANVVVAVAGNSLASRILAERRGEKYLVDVVSSGANMLHDALYKAQILEPIKAALILPEILDQTKWYEGEHRYIDPDKRYIFAFVANSLSGQVAYNLNQASPGEFNRTGIYCSPSGKGKRCRSTRRPSAWERRCISFTIIPTSARHLSKSSMATRRSR